MKNRNKNKKNPLTKGQNRLLKDSLKKLLGNGLIQDGEKERSEVEKMILKNALNAMMLNN